MVVRNIITHFESRDYYWDCSHGVNKRYKNK